DSPRGPTSQYPPGAAIFAAPFYRLANQPHTEVLMRGSNKPDAPPISLPMPSMRPGSVAASVAVAGAMGFMALATVSAAGSWPLGVGAWLGRGYCDSAVAGGSLCALVARTSRVLDLSGSVSSKSQPSLLGRF